MSSFFLSEDELLVKNTVRDYAREQIAPRAAQYDAAEEFPWENFRGLADLGLLGLTIDEQYGGSGGTTRQLVVAIEEIAKACAATSTTFLAHLSLCTQFINMYGTEGQKKEFIPRLISGNEVGAFALTEAGSGSDAGAMQTTVEARSGHYLLNGSKTFITSGPEASILVVLATHDKSLKTRVINAIIMERKTEGFLVNPIKGKMGIRGSSIGELLFENCVVPTENRMGEEGEGFRHTMNVLNASRISIAAQCVGIAQSAYEHALDYIQRRDAFGQSLSNFQGIQWNISEMATSVHAARLMTLQAASLRDAGKPFIKEASMAKLYGSRVAVELADKAVQLHGGVGYLSPSPVERIYRDAKVTEIYEGTSEIQRLIIARQILDSGNI